MQFQLVIKNGALVTAEGLVQADLAIQGERIAAIGQSLSGEKEIDARDNYVLPGAIDGHVHLDNPKFAPYDLPTADSFATGSVAAAFGGVTTVIDFAQPAPGESLIDELERRQEDARGQSVIDYGLHLNLRDAAPQRLAEIPAVIAHGVPSFKVYMAYEGYRLDDKALLRAMEAISAHKGLVIFHAENFDIIEALQARFAAEGKTGPQWHEPSRPAVMEGAAVHKALALGSLTGARVLIFHISCAEGVRELHLAKSRGQAVWGETCTHYLAHTNAVYSGEDDDMVRSLTVAPPIRDDAHQAALWQGLAHGTLDLISSDHCPRPKIEGRKHQASGASGLEVRLALVHERGVRSGRISLNQWVRQCCTAPAEIFGLTRKGKLAPGFDADIVIFDPEKEITFTAETLHSPLSFSSYEGLRVRGCPATTISRGEVVVNDNHLTAAPGRGRFVKRRYPATE